MKRARSNEWRPESSAEAARRLRTREGSSASSSQDTTFFFIRLPTGKTVTADMKLSSTVQELILYLEQKIGRINAPFSVVVGKRLVPRHETLAAAGVSRDCTVQLLLRRVLSPYDYFNQELDKVKSILHNLQRPNQRPSEMQESLYMLFSWLSPDSEDDSVWPALIRFGAVQDVARTVQQAAVSCCALARHPNASRDNILFAAKMLGGLADWAWQGLQYAAGKKDGQVARVYRDEPNPPSSSRTSSTFVQLQWLEVLRVVETWCTAVAALMQVTLYTPKMQGITCCDAVRTLKLCFTILSAALHTLVQWLSAPMSPAATLELNRHVKRSKQPGMRRGDGIPWDSQWYESGQATLVYLSERAGQSHLPPTAALLQGITAMLADHLLSTCQRKLHSLPGLTSMVPGLEVIDGHPHSSSITCIAAARDSLQHSADLAALACASLLVNPAIISYVAQHMPQQGDPVLRVADISWGGGPAAVMVQSVLSRVHESATLRNLHHKSSDVWWGGSSNAIFSHAHSVCWNYWPLLSAGLKHIQVSADFAATEGVLVHKSRAVRMPEFLTADGAALSLVQCECCLQAWLLFVELAGSAARGWNAGDIPTFLHHPMVIRWLVSEVVVDTRATESTIKMVDGDVCDVMQKLLNLVAWAPPIAESIPQSIRRGWLCDGLFPRHPLLFADEDDSQVEFEVRRDHLLEDSYEELLNFNCHELRAGVRVRFKNEDGVGEGVIKEYLVLLAGLLFDPFAALFQCAETDRTVLHPSPTAMVQPNWRQYLRLAGRVVGLALRHRVPLGIRLSSSFFKALQSIEAANATLDVPDTDDLTSLTHHWMSAVTLSRRAVPSGTKQQQGEVTAASVGAGVRVEPFVAWRAEFKFVDTPWRLQQTLEDIEEMDSQMGSSLNYLLDTRGAADEMGLTWSAATAAAESGLASVGEQRVECSGRGATAGEGDVVAFAADDDDDADQAEVASGAASASSPAATAPPAATSSSEVELVPGGALLPVTEGNKQQYVEAVVEHKLLGGCYEQALWFYVGLCDIAQPCSICPCHGRLLLPLTLGDFNDVLGGSHAKLDVTEWREATGVGSSLREEPGQKIVNMFWKVVQGLDELQQRLLLRFWTGITHLPTSGFNGLGNRLQILGLDSPTAGDHQAAEVAAEAAAGDEAAAAEPVAIDAEALRPGETGGSRANAAGTTNNNDGADGAGSSDPAADGLVKRAAVLRLPRAHTCFLQLLLPMGYNSADELREALLIALKNVDYFGQT